MEAKDLKEEALSYYDQVYRIMWSKIKNGPLVKDILQDTYISVHLKLHTYTSEGSLRAWIIGIAMNACKAYIRKSSQMPTMSIREDDSVIYEELYDTEEELRRTMIAISTLKPEHQKIFKLLMKGYTLESISSSTGINYTVVCNIISVQRGVLKALLKNEITMKVLLSKSEKLELLKSRSDMTLSEKIVALERQISMLHKRVVKKLFVGKDRIFKGFSIEGNEIIQTQSGEVVMRDIGNGWYPTETTWLTVADLPLDKFELR